MSAVQLPDDNFELAQQHGINSDYRANILRIRLLQIFAKAALKKNLHIDYELPLYGGETQDQYESDPGVFLAQYINDIYLVDESGNRKKIVLGDNSALPSIPENYRVETAYQYMRFSREKNADDKLVIRAHNLRGDFSAPQKNDQVYMSNLLLENIAAAMFMVQEAKLAGITQVNFGATKDPVKRLALQVACRFVGLDCSSEPAVSRADLPHDTYYKADLIEAMENTRSRFSLLPNYQILLKARNDEQIEDDVFVDAPADDEQALIDDLEAELSSQLDENRLEDSTDVLASNLPSAPMPSPQPNMN